MHLTSQLQSCRSILLLYFRCLHASPEVSLGVKCSPFQRRESLDFSVTSVEKHEVVQCSHKRGELPLYCSNSSPRTKQIALCVVLFSLSFAKRVTTKSCQNIWNNGNRPRDVFARKQDLLHCEWTHLVLTFKHKTKFQRKDFRTSSLSIRLAKMFSWGEDCKLEEINQI